ncbi:hypothetical protein BG004_003974 [Podila humilis]|nr:hypothetical protein BG004_003974 [Podila humilis]
MSQSFAETPELVACLADFLTPHDLFNCIQVSSRWHNALIPSLWHTIDDTSLSWPMILHACGDPILHITPWCNIYGQHVKDSDKNGKGRTWLLHVLRKHRRHIRHLSVHWPMFLEALSLAAKTAEEHDTVEISPSSSSSTSSIIDRFNLTSLTLDIRRDYSIAPHAIATDVRFLTMAQVEAREVVPPMSMSAPLFPGIVEECDFIQPSHYVDHPLPQAVAMETGWVATQHYWHFISKCQNLHRIAFAYNDNRWSPRSIDVLIKFMSPIQHLREIVDCNIKDMAELTALVKAVPTLTKLKLSNVQVLTVESSPPPPSSSETEQQQRRREEDGTTPIVSCSLKHLNISRNYLSIRQLCRLVSLLPTVTHLQLYKVSNIVHPPTSQQLMTFPPPVLSATKEDTTDLPVLYDLTSIFANLQVLDFEAADDYDAVFAHVPEHVEITYHDQSDQFSYHRRPESSLSLFPRKYIRRYNIIKGERPWFLDRSGISFMEQPPPPGFINTILSSNPNVRIIDSIERYILVDEMLRSPWICMGLEQLTCQIIGMERLTEKEEEQAAVVLQGIRMSSSSSSSSSSEVLSNEEDNNILLAKVQRIRAKHHAVYDCLSQLSKLKVLDLGYENRNPWTYKSGETYEVDGVEYLEYTEEPVFDTLELSLDSGLDRLAGLKNLETFGFECINHRVGEAELEWMAKQWPKLRTLRGLQREGLMDIEPCQKREALRTYMERLRPDVLHEGLFSDDV